MLMKGLYYLHTTTTCFVLHYKVSEENAYHCPLIWAGKVPFFSVRGAKKNAANDPSLLWSVMALLLLFKCLWESVMSPTCYGEIDYS